MKVHTSRILHIIFYVDTINGQYTNIDDVKILKMMNINCPIVMESPSIKL